MGKVQLIYVIHTSVPFTCSWLVSWKYCPSFEQRECAYLAQGVITMAGDFPCLPLSSSLIMKGLEVP